MLFYVLEYDMTEENPEGRILWETESESITETQKLVAPKPNHEYEIVSEQQIKEDIEKLYDIGEFLN